MAGRRSAWLASPGEVSAVFAGSQGDIRRPRYCGAQFSPTKLHGRNCHSAPWERTRRWERREPNRRAGFWTLTLGAIGVVYGDIGTSPLYAMRESLLAAGGA